MKTIDIKGKAYVQVHERIIFFRKEYEEWSLTSSLISNEGGQCIIKAEIRNGLGDLKATGHAMEQEGNSFINKGSHIENCETSAWGRALGCLGIGIETSVASAEEVHNAVLNQKKETSPKENNPLEDSKPTAKKELTPKTMFWNKLKEFSAGKLHNKSPKDVINYVVDHLVKDPRSENFCVNSEYVGKLAIDMPAENKGWKVLLDLLVTYDQYYSQTNGDLTVVNLVLEAFAHFCVGEKK